MNNNQIVYQIGRALSGNIDLLCLGPTGLGLYSLVGNFLSGFSPSTFIVGGLTTAYFGWNSFRGLTVRWIMEEGKKEIIRNKSKYPLASASEIIFDDWQGLEMLLTKTRFGEAKEWGTLLNAYNDKERAVISKILPPLEAKKIGLIGKGTSNSLDIKISQAEKEGYDGFHHYHPDQFATTWLGAINFSINSTDKCKPNNWINLLTFNLPKGPEIIGFNLMNTYIPIDKSKKRLKSAKPKQIMEYLKS